MHWLHKLSGFVINIIICYQYYYHYYHCLLLLLFTIIAMRCRTPERERYEVGEVVRGRARKQLTGYRCMQCYKVRTL